MESGNTYDEGQNVIDSLSRGTAVLFYNRGHDPDTHLMERASLFTAAGYDVAFTSCCGTTVIRRGYRTAYRGKVTIDTRVPAMQRSPRTVALDEDERPVVSIDNGDAQRTYAFAEHVAATVAGVATNTLCTDNVDVVVQERRFVRFAEAIRHPVEDTLLPGQCRPRPRPDEPMQDVNNTVPADSASLTVKSRPQVPAQVEDTLP